MQLIELEYGQKMRPVANLCFKSWSYGPFQRGTEGAVTISRTAPAMPVANDVLAHCHSGIAAEWRIAAHAESQRQSRRSHVGRTGDRQRYGLVLRAPAQCLQRRLAGGHRDRTAGAGRGQDAL